MIAGNLARGGDGGSRANGGNGQGGGLIVFNKSTATLDSSTITLNRAIGGAAGSGGIPGNGEGGGLYVDLGATVSKRNNTAIRFNFPNDEFDKMS